MIYEYLVREIPAGNLSVVLKQLGIDGWEVVAMTSVYPDLNYVSTYTVTLKRNFTGRLQVTSVTSEAGITTTTFGTLMGDE